MTDLKAIQAAYGTGQLQEWITYRLNSRPHGEFREIDIAVIWYLVQSANMEWLKDKPKDDGKAPWD